MIGGEGGGGNENGSFGEASEETVGSAGSGVCWVEGSSVNTERV
jgi:hypothetical protein